MKSENQHLDFLISQYVDGCLDATSKKALEQRMVIDPQVRKMLAQHREVQDLLDDWGNRIPWINWEEFDQQLAARLEKEAVGGQKATFWRQWGKVTAVAASLLLAVGVGYTWRAVSSVSPQQMMVNGVAPASSGPRMRVEIERPVADAAGRGSERTFSVAEFPKESVAGRVDILAPANVAAIEALKQTIDNALSNAAKIATQPSSVTAGADKPEHPEAPPVP